MKFEVRQSFDATAEQVIACYASAELYQQLPDLSKISQPELLERTESGERVTLRLRYRFTADLPTAALAVIDPNRLTWVEHTTYDLAALVATTELHPDHYASKLQASATARFVATGDGAQRILAGDLRVRVLLVGGQVERAIVSGLTEHMDEEAVVVAEILASM